MLVLVVRAISALALAGPALLRSRRRPGTEQAGARRGAHGLAPVIANFASFGVYFFALVRFATTADSVAILLLALGGCSVSFAGAGLVLGSRVELGRAWSLLPLAERGTDLVTTGPYRHVRHPIYLGLTLLATGEALAFGSWPALLMVVVGVVPTFAWRARTEEQLLGRTFGESHAAYRRATKMIIPRVL